MAGRNLCILTRSFSTGVSRHAVVKTPVPVYGIEGRYAAALFSAANKSGALDAVEKDLKTISATMDTDPRLGSFLLDPSIKNNIKLDGIGGVCKTLKVNELSKNLLEALAENNRLGFTKAVVASFDTLMAAHRGEVVCTVTTAKELDAGGVLHATDVEFDLDSEPGNDRPDFNLSGIWLMTTDRNSKFEYAWRHEAGSSQFSGFQLTSNGRADPIKLPLSGSVSRDGVVQWFIEGVCCTGKLEDDGHGIADGQFWRTSTKEQLGTFHGQMVFAGIETATRASELGLGRADCQAGSPIEQRATKMRTPSQERRIEQFTKRRSTLSRLCCCFSKPRSTGSSGSMPREASHERRGHSVDEPDTSVD